MRGRDLNLLSGAVGVSALGDFVGIIPIVLYVQSGGGSGFAVAAVFIALWAPSLLLGGVAGALADRRESRGLLRGVSVAQAAVAVILALTYTAGLPVILGLTALLGAGVALAQPAEFALVPAAAGDAGIAAANGRIEGARYLGYALGPVLGGLLAAAGGTTFAVLADAASFALVALAAHALHARREPAPAPAAAPAGRARDGLVFLLRDGVLARVITVAVISLVFMTASATAEVFFAKIVLGAGDAGYGLLMTLWTLGMVAGSLVLAPRVPGGRYAGAALAAIALQGAGLGLPTLWLVLPFALVAYLSGGAGHGAKNVLVRTLLHERVPDALRGRAWAAYGALRNGAEMIALVGGGLLVTALGARTTLLLAGALPLLVVLAALPGVRRGSNHVRRGARDHAARQQEGRATGPAPRCITDVSAD